MSNPSNNTTAIFGELALTAGKYFLKVDGVGTQGFYNPSRDAVFDPGKANYTGPGTTIPWNVANPQGEAFADLTIDVAGDLLFERDEFFQVAIGHPPAGWTIAQSVAGGTILSDESSVGVASLKTAISVQREGDPNSGGAEFAYTLFRRGDTSVTTTLRFQL